MFERREDTNDRPARCRAARVSSHEEAEPRLPWHRNPDTREAAWQQIANQIRTAIVTGKLKAGEMLPSQPRLADHYGVARETAKAALAQFRSEGLITIEGALSDLIGGLSRDGHQGESER